MHDSVLSMLSISRQSRDRFITEFWRRWHISLSSWLKDYLYISLGGNRKGKIRQYANLVITMFLGGLWHGASWNFVVWGLFHGIALAAHKFWMTLTGRKKGEESHGIRNRFMWKSERSDSPLWWRLIRDNIRKERFYKY